MSHRQLTEALRIQISGARAVEPFELDGRSYLAVPQLSSDASGTPPGMNGGDSDVDLLLLRYQDGGYVEHRRLPVPGGEDAEFFRIGDRAFLATASIRHGHGPYVYETDSMIHAWDGRAFVPFQEIPSRWTCNWHFFELAGQHFLAHADHVDPSRLYRWDGERFVPHPVLEGSGGRELAVLRGESGLYLIRINFITGGRANPNTALDSQLYRWQGGRFSLVEEFPTHGGTDVAVYAEGGEARVAVSNSLTADVRFSTDTVIYTFSE
jgi:hypothetical protein